MDINSMFVLLYACLLLTLCVECTTGAGSDKRLILEMDFEQELLNLKNEISGLKAKLSHNEAYISTIQKQLGTVHYLLYFTYII